MSITDTLKWQQAKGCIMDAILVAGSLESNLLLETKIIPEVTQHGHLYTVNIGN